MDGTKHIGFILTDISKFQNQLLNSRWSEVVVFDQDCAAGFCPAIFPRLSKCPPPNLPNVPTQKKNLTELLGPATRDQYAAVNKCSLYVTLPLPPSRPPPSSRRGASSNSRKIQKCDFFATRVNSHNFCS